MVIEQIYEVLVTDLKFAVAGQTESVYGLVLHNRAAFLVGLVPIEQL